MALFLTPADGKKRLWSGLAEHFAAADKKQATPEQFAELQQRLLFRQSIEASRCYAEGVLRSVADAKAPSWLACHSKKSLYLDGCAHEFGAHRRADIKPESVNSTSYY